MQSYRVVGDPAHAPRLVLTVEHASAALPPPLVASADDEPWMSTHWAWDPGAAAVTLALCARLHAVAVLAEFSRLAIDANRPPEHPDLIRTEVEGHALSFNRAVDAAERARRLRTLHAPYHDAIDRTVAATRHGKRVLLISMHSFTPVFAGHTRPMQLGVLYDDHEDLAESWAQALEAEGFFTARNEPYSGREGLIYAAQRHGRQHGVDHLELEMRQDLVATPGDVEAVADAIARSLLTLPHLHD